MKAFFVEVDKLNSLASKDDISPEKKLDYIADHAEKLNRHLKEVAFPYGRGGSDPIFGKILMGWTQLHSQLFDAITSRP